MLPVSAGLKYPCKQHTPWITPGFCVFRGVCYDGRIVFLTVTIMTDTTTGEEEKTEDEKEEESKENPE
jgi:hypothetical protein